MLRHLTERSGDLYAQATHPAGPSRPGSPATGGRSLPHGAPEHVRTRNRAQRDNVAIQRLRRRRAQVSSKGAVRRDRTGDVRRRAAVLSPPTGWCSSSSPARSFPTRRWQRRKRPRSPSTSPRRGKQWRCSATTCTPAGMAARTATARPTWGAGVAVGGGRGGGAYAGPHVSRRRPRDDVGARRGRACCADCLAHHGMVMRASEWRRYPLRPKSQGWRARDSAAGVTCTR
jgi:hypothetical protein